MSLRSSAFAERSSICACSSWNSLSISSSEVIFPSVKSSSAYSCDFLAELTCIFAKFIFSVRSSNSLSIISISLVFFSLSSSILLRIDSFASFNERKENRVPPESMLRVIPANRTGIFLCSTKVPAEFTRENPTETNGKSFPLSTFDKLSI